MLKVIRLICDIHNSFIIRSFIDWAFLVKQLNSATQKPGSGSNPPNIKQYASETSFNLKFVSTLLQS